MKYGVNKKSAEEWVNKILEEYKLTDEYKKETELYKTEFIDYVVYGEPLHYLNGEVVDELIAWPDTVVENYKMSPQEIIEKFKHLLSEDEIKLLEIKEAYGEHYERIKAFINHKTGWCKITEETTPGMCGQTAGSYVINAATYNSDNYMGWAEWMPKKLRDDRRI